MGEFRLRCDRKSKTCTEPGRSIEKLKPVRSFIVLIILLAGCAGMAEAQPRSGWKIGVLVSSTPALHTSRDEALLQGLRALGYEEGKNISIERRYAEGKADRLPQLARELVDQKPDVIVVGGTRVAIAAKKATSTIPIVVAGAGDLVEAKLIDSFMYPGGNITGVARMSADVFGARIKLIKEILPKATWIVALSNGRNPGHRRSLKDADLSARALNLRFETVSAQTPDELDGAIKTAARTGASALFIMTDAMFNTQVSRIAQLTIKNRLPSVYDRNEFVEAGGLMSYGVNLADLSRRAAEYVDKILKGAKPGDLTLVQPTNFDLSINLKTASQIGLTIPPEVLQRAVKVIN
jgi:putative tryptophan/tyrosine transport system substrate-binding protein